MPCEIQDSTSSSDRGPGHVSMSFWFPTRSSRRYQLMAALIQGDRLHPSRRATVRSMGILALLCIPGCSCTCQGGAGTTQQEHDLKHRGDETLLLFISNQSTSRPDIDIEIEVDGKEIHHTESLKRFDGHARSEIRLSLPLGDHTLRAISREGGAEIEKRFLLSERSWAALDYSYNPDRKSGLQQPYFTFSVRDEPIRIR